MKKRYLSLLLCASPLFAQSPRDDQALRSLTHVAASVQNAELALRRGMGTAAASLHSAAYDAAARTPSAPLPVLAGVAPQRPAAPASMPVSASRERVTSAPQGIFSDGYLGLYPESSFELTTGRCASCRAPTEGLWYFLDDVIATPKSGAPSLVWIGSHEMLRNARLSQDGLSIRLEDGSVMPFGPVPRISTNKSFYDAATIAFFQDKPLRVRGEIVEEGGVKRFVARTIWPEDFRVNFQDLPPAPAHDESDISRLIAQNDGGARSPFLTRLLWERTPDAARNWTGRPVIGVMLNGAQGDDDDALAGHFSLFTGRFGPNGEMSDWLFSNFYDMDEVSEKGILPAFVPMDKYMADLNSGQSYYRPTDILVAVLKDESLALSLQEQYKALYAKYYAHTVKYDRTFKPCAALIVDELRADGWNIPTRGPSNILSSLLISGAVVLGGSREDAKKTFIFMRQEKTRLFPRAAFEAIGGDLLNMESAAGPGRELNAFEARLRDSIDALVFIRLPQIPSSRAFGSAAVASTEEYFLKAPKRHSQWKTNPTSPRPFPPPH